jgi:hypothetical protein
LERQAESIGNKILSILLCGGKLLKHALTFNLPTLLTELIFVYGFQKRPKCKGAVGFDHGSLGRRLLGCMQL